VDLRRCDAFTARDGRLNAATASIQSLNKGFLERFPDFQDHELIINFVRKGCGSKADDGDDKSLFFYQGDGQQLSSNSVLCLHITDLLSEFVLNVKGRPTYNPKSGICLTEEKAVLVKCMVQLAMLAEASETDTSLLVDQTTSAMRTLSLGRKCPTWAIFSIQMF